MPQPKVREADDDETEDLPRDEGPADAGAEADDDFDAEQLAPEHEGHTWLGDDGVEGLDVPGEPIDELEAGSALDDSTLAIDDDPLELDPESTWTDGSEAEGELFVGALLDDDEDAAPASADDGSEGLPTDEPPELDETAASVRGEGDELADDLAVSEGEVGLRAQVLPFRDELTVAVASFEGELVQVTPRALYVGALCIDVAIEPGESLAGATPLDDEHLLIWSSGGRAQVLAVFSQRAVALEMIVRRAFADGLGGVWILGDDGALGHLASAPRAERLGELRSLGAVPGAFDLAGSCRDPELLWVLARDGEKARLLSLRGGATTEIALAASPTAITVDEDDRLLVAMGGAVMGLGAGAPAQVGGDREAPIAAMCTVDRALVVLRDGRASRHERP